MAEIKGPKGRTSFVLLRGDPPPPAEFDVGELFSGMGDRDRTPWSERVAYTRRKAMRVVDGGADCDPVPPPEPAGPGGREPQGD